MEKEFKKKFEILKKKYALPSFEELDKEFEISRIEEDELILQDIKKKIIDKIYYYSEILEEMMEPDFSIRTLHEISVFDDIEKENNFRIYGELMKLIRTANLINLDNDEKEIADFINTSFIKWNKLKPELKKIIEKLKEAWEEKEITKEELSYLG